MLNEQAADGWSVVSIVSAGTNVIAYLVRETDADAGKTPVAAAADDDAMDVADDAPADDAPADDHHLVSLEYSTTLVQRLWSSQKFISKTIRGNSVVMAQGIRATMPRNATLYWVNRSGGVLRKGTTFSSPSCSRFQMVQVPSCRLAFTCSRKFRTGGSFMTI